MFLILSSLRQYWKAETNARSGKWKQGLSPAHDPEGKTIGIIGMGGIGSVVGKRCLAFGMKVIYHNRNPISPAPDFECEYVADRDELLKRSDIVSLNLPLNDKTKGSFGKAEFEKMKDGSILINTARGGVVDQEALIEALTNGKVSPAAFSIDFCSNIFLADADGAKTDQIHSSTRPVLTSSPTNPRSTSVSSR